MTQISTLDPMARLAAIADAGSLAAFAPDDESPHLMRWGVVPVLGDGITCARLAVGGARALAMAQDAYFLGGSVGVNHGRAILHLCERALDERPDIVVLLVDSGGVRLHEANAAEWVLAQALRALFHVRRVGIATLAVVTGAAFGGASILASACAHLRLLPRARFGLSGPGVIETTHGTGELDASDGSAVAAVFGAAARAASGIGELIEDSAGAVRGAVTQAAQHPTRFDRSALEQWAATLSARLTAGGRAPVAAPASPPELALFADAQPVDPLGWLWRLRDSDVHLLRALAPQPFGPAQAVAVAQALQEWLPAQAPLVVVEDSAGHGATRSDEMLGISEYLAAHAARLALLQLEGHAVLGLLAGCGHSAAFFVNALQARTLDALAGSRVEAMAPAAVARVTRLPANALAKLIEDDPLMGQPVQHLAALGGVARTHATVSRAELLLRIEELR